MIGIYASAALICVFSMVLGDAVARVGGYAVPSAFAPAVGFCVVVAVGSAAFLLPGHRTTGGVVLALVGVAAIVDAVRQRRGLGWTGVAAGVLTLGVASIPFVLNGHVGILGSSVDDDLAAHFAWASSLGTPSAKLVIFPGYPVGPHTLAADLAGLLGTDVEPPFLGLILAVPALAGVTAERALRELAAPAVARVIGGVLVGMPYLAAAFLAEGSFKELMMGLILLGVALNLRALRQMSRTSPVWSGLTFGFLFAGAALVNGLTGLAWPAAAVGLWAVASLALSRRLPSREELRLGALVGVGGLATLIVACLSEAYRLTHFTPNLIGGNVPNYISGYEVLGVWNSGAFQSLPSSLFHAGVLVGLALAVAGYAVIWWTRAKDPAVPMAAAGSIVLYLVVHHRTGPYGTAKALAIAAAPVMLFLVTPLATAWGDRRSRLSVRLISVAAGLAFAVAALVSTGFALRYARVGSDTHADELAPVRAIVRGEPTLFLAVDNAAGWELRGAVLSVPLVYADGAEVAVDLRKPAALGSATDVDSVVPSELDRFRYIVSTNTLFASQMPPNWHLVLTTLDYQLWQRTGATPLRGILAEGEAPGAVLNCQTASGLSISRMTGVAGVWDPAPVGPAVSWSIGGQPIPASPQGFVSVPSGDVLTQTLALPQGRWELSLQYQGPVGLVMDAGATRVSIPSNLDTLGPFTRVADVTSEGGPVTVTLHIDPVRWRAAVQGVGVGALAAVALPRRIVTVPLAKACGRYVDWYEK